MNKKKALIWGGIGVATAVIMIGLIIVLISGGNDNKKEKATETTGLETTTEVEKDTEETTEEKTTEEPTTEEKPVVKEEPTEEQLEYREMLKNQVLDVKYDSYKEAYLYMLRLYGEAYKYGEVKCSVIDFDGDDVLELVIDVNSGITMYTFNDGKVYKLIDDWGYGAGGNHGYEYIAGKGVISNYNTDYAGVILYETYTWIKLEGEKVVTEQRFLKQEYFDDVNNNGVPDDGDDLGGDFVRFYIGEEEVTADKYAEAIVEGDYVPLVGEWELQPESYDISRALEKPDLVKVSDEGCRKAYLDVIEQFELATEEDMSRSYALIDFNGDDTLELVCQRGGHRISFYMYEDGQVYQLMDDWSWGAGANHGYEYIPGENILRNCDSNTGEYIISYDKINNNDLELMYNIVIEWGEYKEDGIDRYYKYTKDGEIEITEEEYNELDVEGNFRLIEGWYSREEIEGCLK